VKDFKSHLAGRLAYVAWLNPAKGEKLIPIFNAIQWPEESSG
jgi:RNA-directed DNA polymerase